MQAYQIQIRDPRTKTRKIGKSWTGPDQNQVQYIKTLDQDQQKCQVSHQQNFKNVGPDRNQQ